MEKLKFYNVDAKYAEYLRTIEKRVPEVKNEKENRPFIGVAFKIGKYAYYAPLSSPKEKHKRMKNSIDFLKIKSGELGAINLNNMIPVPEMCLKKVDISVKKEDIKETIQYKILMQNQLYWCNNHRETIIKKAEKLYNQYTDYTLKDEIKERCCNFAICEKMCDEYANIHNR